MDKDIEAILLEGEFKSREGKRKNSKGKGNRYENDVAKRLNKLFNTEEFQRTPGSGAFATTHNLPEHLEISGDLITPKDFRFTIECKKGYNVDFHDVFKGGSTIMKFIKQAITDSRNTEKEFLVIYKKDYKDEIVILSERCPIENELVLNGKYFIYLSKDFFKLPKDFFFSR